MFPWGLCLENISIPCAIVLPFPNEKGAYYSPPLRKGKLRHRRVVDLSPSLRRGGSGGLRQGTGLCF